MGNNRAVLDVLQNSLDHMSQLHVVTDTANVTGSLMLIRRDLTFYSCFPQFSPTQKIPSISTSLPDLPNLPINRAKFTKFSTENAVHSFSKFDVLHANKVQVHLKSALCSAHGRLQRVEPSSIRT